MNDNKEKKVLLSLRNVEVKFNVRGRILTAIRNVSLDIYENEALAIVGESGSGKSVLTKTFAGMLDSNGFIPQGSIIFSDDEISKTDVKLTPDNRRILKTATDMLNKLSPLERGAAEFRAIQEKKQQIEQSKTVTMEEEADYQLRIKEISDSIIDRTNYLWTLDRKADTAEYTSVEAEIKKLKEKRSAIERERDQLARDRTAAYKKNTEKAEADKKTLADLTAKREAKIKTEDKSGNPYGLTDAVLERNKIIGYEIVLSIGRYPLKDQIKFLRSMKKDFKTAMSLGEDLKDPKILNGIFDHTGFRVQFESYDKENETLHGTAIIDCAKVKHTNDWQKIRGCRIATVFQDPMTSLNPVITIGKQIMTVIKKHQKCSDSEARARAIDIMGKVGIPDPEKRFDDYPFSHSCGRELSSAQV